MHALSDLREERERESEEWNESRKRGMANDKRALQWWELEGEKLKLREDD